MIVLLVEAFVVGFQAVKRNAFQLALSSCLSQVFCFWMSLQAAWIQKLQRILLRLWLHWPQKSVLLSAPFISLKAVYFPFLIKFCYCRMGGSCILDLLIRPSHTFQTWATNAQPFASKFGLAVWSRSCFVVHLTSCWTRSATIRVGRTWPWSPRIVLMTWL